MSAGPVQAQEASCPLPVAFGPPIVPCLHQSTSQSNQSNLTSSPLQKTFYSFLRRISFETPSRERCVGNHSHKRGSHANWMASQAIAYCLWTIGLKYRCQKDLLSTAEGICQNAVWCSDLNLNWGSARSLCSSTETVLANLSRDHFSFRVWMAPSFVGPPYPRKGLLAWLKCSVRQET